MCLATYREGIARGVQGPTTPAGRPAEHGDRQSPKRKQNVCATGLVTLAPTGGALGVEEQAHGAPNWYGMGFAKPL